MEVPISGSAPVYYTSTDVLAMILTILQALCTEAALNAIQRRYPQIYKTSDRLLLKPDSIQVQAKDFMMSVKSTFLISCLDATVGHSLTSDRDCALLGSIHSIRRCSATAASPSYSFDTAGTAQGYSRPRSAFKEECHRPRRGRVRGGRW